LIDQPECRGRERGAIKLVQSIIIFSCGAAGIAVATCALIGWGRLLRHLTGLPNGTWPVSAVLGLAVSLFIGGILNLCRIAYPPALATIVVAGLALAVLFLKRDGSKLRWPALGSLQQGAAFWCAVVVLLTVFAIKTQLAPSVYNHGDDFQLFFAHAVRMVETGTLYGSPLNALGGEGLGGQPFLQGFIIGYFPLNFINGADAVFCFFLCLILPGSVALGRQNLWFGAIIGTLAVFLIDPQYVNVSSLYSMSAVISALIIFSVDQRESGDANSWGWPQAAAPALLYAGAIALKPTSIVFLGPYFVASMAISLWRARDWRTGVTNPSRIVLWSIVFLSPWLLLYAPYYFLAVTEPIGMPSTVVPEVHEKISLFSLFSPSRTFNGASILAYTCLCIALFICGVFAAKRARGEPENGRAYTHLAAASVAAAATYLFWVLYGPQLQELTNTLRYSIPVLIGAFSAALPLSGLITMRPNNGLCSTIAVVLLLLFAAPTFLRVGKLLHQGSELGYLQHWNTAARNRNIEFEARALNGQFAADVRQLQERVPPGQALLVWTTVPFLLDYRRNKIVDANVAGLSQPWGRISVPHYVLWQPSGYGAQTERSLGYEIRTFGRRVGSLDARALDVLWWLQNISSRSEILGERNGMLLFRTDARTLLPPN
jgi:hypothetical protein